MAIGLAAFVGVLVAAMSVLAVAAIVHSWRHGDTDLEMWRDIIGPPPKTPTSVQPTDAMELARRVSDK